MNRKRWVTIGESSVHSLHRDISRNPASEGTASMTATLEPTLTSQDVKILDAVLSRPGVRARAIHRALYHKSRRTRETPVTLDEVRLTLRGLAHLGYVTQRSGWWGRLPTPDRPAT